MVDAEGPRPADPDSQGRVDGSGWTIRVDADEVGRVLLVRNRRPGDRLAPLGLGGHKKVQDILVDRKVARPQRDAVPIVTTGDGRLIWVAGHVMSDDFRVTARTTGVITLNLRRI